MTRAFTRFVIYIEVIDFVVFKTFRIDQSGLSVIGVVGVISAFSSEEHVLILVQNAVSCRSLGFNKPVDNIVCILENIGLELTCHLLIIVDPCTGCIFSHYSTIACIETEFSTVLILRKNLFVKREVGTVQFFVRFLFVILSDVDLCPWDHVVDRAGIFRIRVGCEIYLTQFCDLSSGQCLREVALIIRLQIGSCFRYHVFIFRSVRYAYLDCNKTICRVFQFTEGYLAPGIRLAGADKFVFIAIFAVESYSGSFKLVFKSCQFMFTRIIVLLDCFY